MKNVSVNEPFFQGHYPEQPIMPGVLIVEAMAQLGGLLLLRKLELTGRLPVLLSIDRVKFRRAVVPGDQIRLEAETVRLDGRAGTHPVPRPRGGQARRRGPLELRADGGRARMKRIHPTAMMDPQAELGEDVEVGPYCVVEGPASVIGARTVLRPHVTILGDTMLGEANVV